MMSEQWDKEALSGKGIKVGIIDEGFNNFTKDQFTKDLNVIETKDFVSNTNTNIFSSGSSHGALVAKNFGGKSGNEVYGMAYNAEFYLAVTDDVKSETKDDERRLLEAIRWMISKGVRVINISLGYKTFDNTQEDYKDTDMYNNSTISAKGINDILIQHPEVILVTATGNSLRKDQVLLTPADARLIVSVASCNMEGGDRIITSRIGIENKPYIKPDVATYPVFAGTSFATPSIAGLITTILQRKPNLTNTDVLKILHNSGTFREKPNVRIGYGIPQTNLIWTLTK